MSNVIPTMKSQNNLPITIVIFGASGDLTQRMIIPALYNLYRKQRLPEHVQIAGFASQPATEQEFCTQVDEHARTYVTPPPEDASWNTFIQRMHYISGNFTDQADFQHLKQFLEKMEGGPANRLYYLAIAPRFFATVVEQLGKAGMANDNENEGWRRVIVEKPFGRDLQSAEELNRAIHSVFHEDQVYRIDHYLGKETAQNVLFFRFANTIFEPVWNRNYIDNVQITVAEEVDVGHRGGYYDQAGVLRDMFQNHVLQLLTLIAMEPPASFHADAVRNEKVKVLTALRPITPEATATETVRAQYEEYSQAPDVKPNSQTPTYAALRVFVDNWRWQDVPFYLRSGKAMAEKRSEIVISFTCPPHLMFHLKPGEDLLPNIISICIQPDEGIHLRFETKVPDSMEEMQSVDMEFTYKSTFRNRAIPSAYERLLLDALNGDAALFTRSDEIEASWTFIDPILQGWDSPHAPPLLKYRRGSWGPPEAVKLLQPDCDAWRLGCGQHADKPPAP